MSAQFDPTKPLPPEPKTSFSVVKNQKNSASVAFIAAIAGMVGSMIHGWASAKEVPDLPSKDVIAFFVAGGIGYVMEAGRDAYRFLIWPLFKQWYKRQFGTEPEGE